MSENAIQSVTVEPTTANRPGRASRVSRLRRGRGRLDIEARRYGPRTRRAHDRHERTDLDGMYLADMAASHVLGAEQEVDLARSISASGRTILEAMVRAPAGAQALARLGSELERGTIDIRDVLLNPDQEGIDLDAVKLRVTGALATAGSNDELARQTLVETLADVRFDGEIVDGIIAAIHSASEANSTGANADEVVVIDRAAHQMKRDKERFVVGNLRLVVLFARKYLNRGVPLLDLVQEGNLGLMRAADKFDHRRGFRISTYAAWWIKQALQRALLDRALRLPVHVADDRRRVGKVRAAFQTRHMREPTVDEIAKTSGLSKERIENILTLPAQPTSLDAPLGDDGDASLGDTVASPVAPPDSTATQHALASQLGNMLGTLTPREQQVLRMRFGIDDTREHTLEEVGRALSLTRERIRQIERGALDKLRARSDRVELRSFLEG